MEGKIAATFFCLLLAGSFPAAGADIADHIVSSRSNLTPPGDRYPGNVIVYTAHQEWLSRIYILRLNGSVIDYFEYSFYYFADLEVVDNEVYAAEAFAPRVFTRSILTPELSIL